MKEYRIVLFDLDGTLYRGEEAVPFAVDAVKQIRRRGVLVRYLTNNSSQTRTFYRDKLRRLGFEAEIGEVYSSATCTAAYLGEQGLTSAFVVGMPGLVATLRESEVSVVNGSDAGLVSGEGRQAQAAVVGICLNFTYELMNGAMQQILAGARYVATNSDATFPLESGRLTPGAGSLVAAVSTCSGAQPFVVGKPNPFMVEEALRDAAIPVVDALVVGDRLDTDIECGRRAGCDTHLVLTGVEKVAPAAQPWSEDLRGLL